MGLFTLISCRTKVERSAAMTSNSVIVWDSTMCVSSGRASGDVVF